MINAHTKGNDEYYLHKNIIINGFVVGTLAFIVARSWNTFIDKVIIEFATSQEAKNSAPNSAPNSAQKSSSKGDILYYGIAALVITVFAVLVVIALIQFELLRHPMK